MKFKKNIVATAMALTMVAGVALAAAPDANVSDTTRGPGYGMMDGKGPHHGQKGHHGSFGKKGMRGGGQGCGMAGAGKGMGRKGMMHGGMMGMMQGGPGMHHGAAMNPEMRQKMNQFMDSTKELRKEVHDKQFAYVEAQRNPALTQGEVQKQEADLYTLRQELRTKHQEFFKTEQ